MIDDENAFFSYRRNPPRWALCQLLLFVFALPNQVTVASDRFLIADADGFSSGTIRDIALSHDGRWLAAAGGKQVRVWRVETGTLVASLRGEQLAPHLKMGRANAVAFSPDGKYLMTGISDNTDAGSTRKYRMDDLTGNMELIDGHTACSDRIAFSEDGVWLASYG